MRRDGNRSAEKLKSEIAGAERISDRRSEVKGNTKGLVWLLWRSDLRERILDGKLPSSTGWQPVLPRFRDRRKEIRKFSEMCGPGSLRKK